MTKNNATFVSESLRIVFTDLFPNRSIFFVSSVSRMSEQSEIDQLRALKRALEEGTEETPQTWETDGALRRIGEEMRRWYLDTGEKEGLKRKGKREEILDEPVDKTDPETQLAQLHCEIAALRVGEQIEWEGWDEWEELKLEEGRRLRREVEVLGRDGKASSKEDLSIAKIAARPSELERLQAELRRLEMEMGRLENGDTKTQNEVDTKKLNEIEEKMIEWEVDAENNMFRIMKGRDVEKLTQWIKVHPCFVNLQLEDEDYCGLSPLHCASNDGHLEVVELLLSLGAKVDIQTHDVGVPFSFIIISYFDPDTFVMIHIFWFIYLFFIFMYFRE